LVDRLLGSPQFGVRWDGIGSISWVYDTISFDDDYNAPIGFLAGKCDTGLRCQ